MKRTIISILGVLLASLILLMAVPAAANGDNTIEVTQPVQLTNSEYYERGQSIVYDGTNYWLFYGRSASCTGTYQTGAPDGNDYVLFYKKASTVADLASAPATAVIGDTIQPTGVFNGETGAAYYDGKVWAFAPIDDPDYVDREALYGWYTTDGSSWTAVGPFWGNKLRGSLHHDEVSFGGELWIVEGAADGDITTRHGDPYDPTAQAWVDSQLNISLGPSGGIVHFFVDGGELYLAGLECTPPESNIIYHYDVGLNTWVEIDSVPSGGYDPTLFKVGSTYVFAQAPWESSGAGDWQYTIAWSSNTLNDTFFDRPGDPVSVTEGQYGSNVWVDMWPIGFTDSGGNGYLFFTSERNPSNTGSEIAGNIWYLPVTWDVSRNHYTYIQEAIDAASAGDTINVAAGEYAGAIVNKSVNLVGAADGSSVIISGVPYKPGNDAHISAFRPEADGAEIRNFTIDCGGAIDLGVYAMGVDNVIIDSLTIINDTLQGITNWGGSGWQITNNVIDGTVASGGGGIGILLGANFYSATPLPICSNNLVQYNTINATATAETYSCPAILVHLDLRYGGYEAKDGTEDVSGNQILDNTITSSGVENTVGIEVGTILGNSETDPDRTDPDKIAAIMAKAAVHNNTVSGNVVDGADEGFYLYNATNTGITGNGVANSVSDGIYVEYAQSGTTITGNTLSNNEVQVKDDTQTLVIENVLANNTFDRAVTVDHPGGSLLYTIWSKIQDAIDATVAGDTVFVGAGTYDENIDINKIITLQGAGSDVTGTILQNTISPTLVSGSPYDWKPVVIISSSGIEGSPILLEDLMIRVRQDIVTGGQLPGILPLPGSTVSYVELNNVHIIGTQSEGTAEAGITVDDNTSLDHLVVSNCEFNDMAYGMIFFNTSNTGTMVQNVEISNTTFDGNSIKGFYAEKLSDTTLTNVTVTNNGNTALSPDWADPNNAGIDINLKYGSYQNLAFNNLTVTGNGIGSANGVGLTVKARGTGSDTSYSSNPASLDGVTVNGGTFTGNEAGIRFGEPDKDNTEPTNITVNHASISGNTQFGLSNVLSSVTVDATNNWWGTASGPAHAGNTYNIGSQGDAVSDNVDYVPWLDNTFATGASFAPVTTDEVTPGQYSSIQAAINGVTGTTITCAPGMYTERIVIDKPLTLLGATWDVNKNGYPVPDDYAWDTSVESVINNPSGGGYNVVDIYATNDVTVKGFVIQSLDIPAYENMANLLRVYADAPGTCDNIVVQNNVIGPNTDVDAQDGTLGRMGLYLSTPTYPSDGFGITNSTFSGNKIFDCLGNGNNVFIWGAAKNYNSPANADYTGTVIEDNEIYGSHRSGIEISGGVDNLVIRNNDIYGNSGIEGDDPNNQKYGSGIVIIRIGSDYKNVDAMGANNLEISDNNIYDNEKNGIYLGPINTNHNITGNTFSGNGWDGIRVDLTEVYDGRDTAYAVYDVADNITTQFNNIDGNGGYGVQVIGEPTNGFVFDATRNWWGTEDGATIVTKVSDNVDYSPWWGANYIGVAHPWTWYTNDSIQDAIDIASAGDTINVLAGTYNECISITKPLTLLGATWNVNKNGYTVPAGYAWDDTVESIITNPSSIPTPNTQGGYIALVDIYDTSDVTFKGFIVQELNASGNTDDSLVRVRAQTQPISNIIFQNNVIGPFTNTTSQDGKQGRMGLYLVNNPYSDQFGIVNSTFSGNKIFGCEGNGNNVFIWSSYKGYGAAGPASMAGTVIEDNEIYGAHRSGIETAGGFSDLIIRNNSIYGNYKLPGDTPDLKYGNGIVMIRGSSDRENVDGYGPVNVTLEDNNIHDNDGHGIYMGPNNQGVTFTGNDVQNNGQDGIIVDLIGNYHNPDFETSTGPFTNLAGSQDVAGSFNNIYDNAGLGVRVVGEPTNDFVFDATNNWWGTKSEAVIATKVSDHVDYEPYIGADVTKTKSKKTEAGDDNVDAKDEANTEVEKKGTGTPTVTVAKYKDNPGAGFSGDTGSYVDVHLDDIEDVEEITIKLYYTEAEIAGVIESSLRLRWWDGTDWIVCSDSGVNTADIPGPPAYAGYMWAKIRADTIPNLTQMSGTVFGGGGETSEPEPAPIPGPGAIGGVPGADKSYLIVDMLGKRTQVEINESTNTTVEELLAYDEEGMHLLELQAETLIKCGDCEGGNCYPEIIVMSLSDETIEPPEGMTLVGPIYDFTGYTDIHQETACDLATYFDPMATVLLNYDPELLPLGASEPVIGFYSHTDNNWVLLTPDIGRVAEVGTATGVTGYFASPFAVLASTTPTEETPEPPPSNLSPAHFVASGLSITPAEVKTGEAVTISLNVANDGEESGTYTAELQINGSTVDSKVVTLDGGQSQSVSFAVTSSEAGTYDASVAGLNGSFTVVKSSIWWIYLIIAAVVIILGVVALSLRRGRG